MMKTTLRTTALFGVALSLAGCEHWFARRETISYQGGDAVAWNRAIHMIDPWPAVSADTTIPVSGRRVANTIERYETGIVEENGSAPASGSPIAPVAIP
jgi:hypothetical protein